MATADLALWLKRLGHSYESKLNQVDLLESFTCKLKNKICDSCVKVKHTRLPFPLSSIKMSSCFELFHVDVWGGSILRLHFPVLAISLLL